METGGQPATGIPKASSCVAKAQPNMCPGLGLLADPVASLVSQRVKHLPAMQETQVRFLGREDPLEKEIATHSSILAWKIPWMEKPGRLQSTGLQRVRHD